MAHTMANPVKPEVIKMYIASKNRRKSIATLPPCSWVYDLTNPVMFTWHGNFLLQSVPFATCGIQSY